MERDTFIITIYGCIANLTPVLMKDNGLCQGGFSPKLSDAEVIAIEVCSEFGSETQ